MALLSTTTLRTDYLPDVASTDSDAIAVLGRQLQRAEDMVARYLGYPGSTPTLASTSYTLRLEGRRADPHRLLLPVAPVTAVASVYQDSALTFAASTLVAAADYEREDFATGAYLHLLPGATSAARWATARRSIKVTCTAGYTNEAAMPDDLAGAIYAAVAEWWLKRRVRHLDNASAGGVSQGVNQGLGIQPLGAIPDDARELLAAYVLLGALGVT